MTYPAGLTPRSQSAAEIEWLWQVMLVLGTVAFLIFTIPLVIGLFKDRAAHDEDPPPPTDSPVGRIWLTGGGVVLPVLMIGATMVFTLVVMDRLATAPEDALTIEVTGNQWWWEVRYPEDGVVLENEMRIPVGRPVELLLTSSDVIHSFWVPPLGGKLDALPDGVNTLVIEAMEVGEYRGQCAEFCGLAHATMKIMVIAMPVAEYEAWLSGARQASAQPVLGGAR